MNTTRLCIALGRSRAVFTTFFALLLAVAVQAQRASPSITTAIDDSERVTLAGSRSPLAYTATDTGAVPEGKTLRGMSVVFRRSQAQSVDLENLIAAQQDPASPLYHQWLTPQQFGARFGVASSDLAKVQAWLKQQGFTVSGVSPGRNRIRFSGKVQQVKSAFGTGLHYYKVNGTRYYAPAGDLTIPSALASVVESVSNLSSMRPRPYVVNAGPRFTSAQSGNHYLTPGDVATIYDIAAAYSSGYKGAGQSIAVVGQSEVVLSDIEKFQSAAGLTVKDPVTALVPDSGTSVVSSGDESESDLDLEYTTGIAPGATIYLVYVGNSANYSVWDSIDYAIETRIAPVISVSYGLCEAALSTNDYATLESMFAQAAVQGQSVVAASGDTGSTNCYGVTSLSQTQQEALAVDYPASSEYVTGMGGTEFPAADVASGNTTYWQPANGSDAISSSLSYIPEQVWNDDSSSSGLAAGGGGVSTMTARPNWQAGVPGIPSGSYRLVPDISLDASAMNAGYLYCSSDASTGVTGSCSEGFRDANNTYLTVAGGTSFDSPIFSAMLAVINQKINSTGQGVVSPTLYTLASDSGTYETAFHDITDGGNQCAAGSDYCSSNGASQYVATTGYDQASGLGSVDFNELLNAWPTNGSASLTASITTLSAATNTPDPGANDRVTISLAAGSGSGTPTGTVTLSIDGSDVAQALTLSNGSAMYTFSSNVSGSHVIVANYSGDATYAASTGSLVLMIGSGSSGNPGFTIGATNVTIVAGHSGTSNITITPANGYTGTIAWTVTVSPSLSNYCYTLSKTTITGSGATTAVMNIYSSSSSCSSSLVGGPITGRSVSSNRGSGVFDSFFSTLSHAGSAPTGLAMLGLLVGGALMLRLRVRAVLAGGLAVLLAMTFVGCGGAGSSSSSSSNSVATKGSYTVTIVGTDTTTSSTTATTTMTLTID